MARLREAEATDDDDPMPAPLLALTEADWLPLVGPTPEGWPEELRPWPGIRAASLWSAARRRWLVSHGVAHGDWHKFQAPTAAS